MKSFAISTLCFLISFSLNYARYRRLNKNFYLFILIHAHKKCCLLRLLEQSQSNDGGYSDGGWYARVRRRIRSFRPIDVQALRRADRSSQRNFSFTQMCFVDRVF